MKKKPKAYIKKKIKKVDEVENRKSKRRIHQKTKKYVQKASRTQSSTKIA